MGGMNALNIAEYTQTLSSIAPVLDLAPNVEATGYLDGLKHQTTVLGEVFGAQSAAERLNAELDDAAAEASALTNGQTVFLANHNGGKIDNGAGRMAPLIYAWAWCVPSGPSRGWTSRAP